MLELSKKVLTGVSFDKILFKKELKKAIAWLAKEEITHFKIWCLASFAMYDEIIVEVFESL